MSEEMLVKYCSPTLAGLKTGNLFNIRYDETDELYNEISRLNRLLVPRGVTVVPLRCLSGKAMIYMFRPEKLRSDLRHGYASKLLKSKGYRSSCVYRCIKHLAEKLRISEEFPHEIGLFLGYPPEDVQGFIENRCEDCKCTGYWKVYGDADEAEKQFSRFRRCTDLYWKMWEKGHPIESLAVAG